MKKKITYTRMETIDVEVEGDILETNSAQGDSLLEEKSEMTAAERKHVKSTVLTAGIALLIVVVVLVVGAVVGSCVQKEEADREPREDTPVFTAAMEEDERKENDITSAITEAYYTVSNGMMVTVEFFNGTETDVHISKVVVDICNAEDVQIANAQSTGMKSDFVVASGGTNEITMYIKPEYVFVTDDLLETLRYEIAVTRETR